MILPPPALGDHLLGGFLGSDQNAEAVDLHDQLPVLIGDVEKVQRLIDAGVVEHDVEFAKFGDGGLHRLAHVRPAGGIRPDANGAPARVAALGSRHVNDRGIDIDERDVGALAQQRLRDGAADAARRAGYETRTTRKTAHIHRPRWKFLCIRPWTARRTGPPRPPTRRTRPATCNLRRPRPSSSGRAGLPSGRPASSCIVRAARISSVMPWMIMEKPSSYSWLFDRIGVTPPSSMLASSGTSKARPIFSSSSTLLGGTQ